MTKTEQKVLTAMRRLNKAFAELHKERGVSYDGRFSACRIPPEGEEKKYITTSSVSLIRRHLQTSLFSLKSRLSRRR